MSPTYPQRPTTYYRRIVSGDGKSSTRNPRTPDLLGYSPLHGAHSPPPLRPSTTPLPPSPLTRPPIISRANSMMYDPYQWGNAGVGSGNMMQGGYNPYMVVSGNQAGSTMDHTRPTSARSVSHADGGLRPYDSSMMKQGRMGHYGYLEGRELAGPPPNQAPAGWSPAAHQNHISPYNRPENVARSAYYPGSQAGSAAGAGGSMAWGDGGNTPRARYDGSSSATGYVQADLDTPYPRTTTGGASSAFTRYGPDGSVANGIDGRMGINHRRLREGKV
ncbi:uncharacterized protein IL334_007805 [Kwoniella shivajii]|uniref:Uncharacterized protein n=1 Tax=Kwoniella shivajii TaxID=564305 RepID=A0ABZ1DCT6_9TREE|nr:hypothetical protein IL334_007805 [Kwoniella shivajii]